MSKWLALLFALSTVLLQVFSQLAMKSRVMTLAPVGMGQGGFVTYLWQLLCDPWVLSALLAAFLGMLTWLLALSKLPLSQAYPFVALTIPVVAILGAALFDETISLQRGVGLSAIALGVLCVALS